jgi:glycosyltransferase involved in cell wall biosynthesis
MPLGKGRAHVNGPRVAYLLKKFPRLSETFVLGELLEQERRGSRIHVFSRREPDDEPRHAELARLRADVEVLPRRHALNPWSELFGFPGGAAALLDPIQGLLAEAEAWGHPKLHELLAEALYLRRRADELGVEHVHVHFATDSAVTAMLLERLGGPGYSVTLHAKDIYRSTVDPALLDRVLASSRFCVTVCDANARYLAERVGEGARARLRRLYNGIDLSAFTPRVPGSGHPARILSIGRLVEKKGFDVLLEALAIVRGRRIPFEASIIGDGEARDDLLRRRAALGLETHVEMPGALDQTEVRRRLAEGTVFCLPCVVGDDGNRDALPTVLLEAQAVGVPIVSTPVTGIPEILDGGRAGVLVPERDPRATAAALERLLGDPEERARLERAGLARVRELFDLKRSGDTLNAWFRSAAAEVACA